MVRYVVQGRVADVRQRLLVEALRQDSLGKNDVGLPRDAQVTAAVAHVDGPAVGVAQHVHRDALAVGRPEGAPRVLVRALQLQAVIVENGRVRPHGEAPQAVPLEDLPDEQLDAIAEDHHRHPVRFHGLDKRHGPRIERDARQQGVEFRGGDAHEVELLRQALARADLAALPALLDDPPGVVDRVPRDQFVQHVLLRERAVEVDPELAPPARGQADR